MVVLITTARTSGFMVVTKQAYIRRVFTHGPHQCMLDCAVARDSTFHQTSGSDSCVTSLSVGVPRDVGCRRSIRVANLFSVQFSQR